MLTKPPRVVIARRRPRRQAFLCSRCPSTAAQHGEEVPQGQKVVRPRRPPALRGTTCRRRPPKHYDKTVGGNAEAATHRERGRTVQGRRRALRERRGDPGPHQARENGAYRRNQTACYLGCPRKRKGRFRCYSASPTLVGLPACHFAGYRESPGNNFNRQRRQSRF